MEDAAALPFLLKDQPEHGGKHRAHLQLVDVPCLPLPAPACHVVELLSFVFSLAIASQCPCCQLVGSVRPDNLDLAHLKVRNDVLDLEP